MNNAPPPPPPHGEAPKSSGLPPGKYDIFIIPPHSSGSGFLYLPSLKPNVNSFAAGFASALIMVALGSMLAPAFQVWWATVRFAGGMGTILLILAVGVGAWALGRTQTDGGPGPGGGPDPGAGTNTGAGAHAGSNSYTSGPAPGSHQPGASTGAGAHAGSNSYTNGPAPGSHQPGAQTGHQPAPGPTPGAGPAGGDPPRSSWQRPAPGATGANTTNNTQPNTGANTTPRPNPSMPNNAAKGAWEKAREETKRKEDERKAKEAEKKRKEDLEKRLKEMREKDAREREAREKVAKEKMEREAREARLKELKEKREKMKAEEDSQPKGSTYAFSSVGEKTNPWPRGQPAPPAARSQPSSPTKKPPPPPTAKTYLGTEEDGYSYRPYDKPKKPMHKKSHSSLYSESSYAASHSTSRTTPPPSNRGPYSTKDPDKIVIKAVYAFNNTFLKTPTSQLVSGVGSVTDGLILRITTEGLFIDDDVRGVPQREWDVKAWTMKLVEVWCPSFRQDPAGTSARVASSRSPQKHNPVRRLWGLDKEKAPTSEETDALLVEMVQLCKNNCRLNASATSPSVASSSVYSASSVGSSDARSETSFASSYASSAGSPSPSYKRRTDNRGAHQTGELKSARLHILRASIRDQEGKKFVFVITEEESWKISVGLQRLRKGSLVRAFGVSGMSANDARGTLESLGWV
ncbi:hypothetical protein D0Z07_6305 [Hyphodiscus hymeniophilus]|uniref:Uncharacterized protein n=1 Tax=Hyphodiscus hymeniophilus TaxID=353542 RepID=A0A9P6VFD3_9HELO|nr:hypothetical protein D0Z07_6305 [Hyphodiscus hymeniophilus]